MIPTRAYYVTFVAPFHFDLISAFQISRIALSMEHK